MNGDGYDDVVIGSAGGNLYIVFGKAAADWGYTHNLYYDGEASYVAEYEDDFDAISTAIIGDMNDDGYDDFLCGAPFNDDGGTSNGKVYLLLGKPDGWQQHANINTAEASFVGTIRSGLAGYTVDGIGDVNGDGIPDFVIGARDGGKIYVFFGRRNVDWGINCSIDQADVILEGEPKNGWTGWRVAGAGDVNADGYADFLVGAPFHDQLRTDAERFT